MTGELRQYEADWLDRIRAESASRVLIVGPTGSGKTVVAATMMRDAVTEGKVCLFVAHRIELVRQTVERLREHGVPAEQINVIAPGYTMDMLRPVHVASIQTLTRRGIGIAPDLVFVDEAHHAAADTWRRAIEGWVAAGARVYGLTATPCRLDGRPLGDLFDAMVESEPVEKLIAARWLVAPRVWTVKQEDRPVLDGIKVIGGDYAVGELERACNRKPLIGKIVEHWKLFCSGMPTVVYAVTVKHADRIAAEFIEHGFRAAVVHGQTRPDVRKDYIRRLTDGTLDIIVNCMVLTEGWDCPAARCAIIARPTKSESLWIQMCGRVMRPGAESKIMDHAGNYLTHSVPWASISWSLTQKKKTQRTRATLNEKECPACGCTCSGIARTCQFCGHEFWTQDPPAEVKAWLEEVSVPKQHKCSRCGKQLTGGSSAGGAKMCIDCYNASRARPRLHCRVCGCELSNKAHLRGTTICRTCNLKSRTGENHPLWKGGISGLPCEACGSKHRVSGQTLCRKCLAEKHRVEGTGKCTKCGCDLHSRSIERGVTLCRKCTMSGRTWSTKRKTKDSQVTPVAAA